MTTRMQKRIVLCIAAGVTGAGLAGAFFFGCAAPRPSNLGARAGRLSPCPDSPNCVSSEAATSSERYVPPLSFEGGANDAWQRAREAALSLPGAQLVEERDDYLWIEVTTRALRFVDDLELLLDANERRIDVRSSSRVGYSDLGANRRRVEALREEFERQR